MKAAQEPLRQPQPAASHSRPSDQQASKQAAERASKEASNGHAQPTKPHRQQQSLPGTHARGSIVQSMWTKKTRDRRKIPQPITHNECSTKNCTHMAQARLTRPLRLRCTTKIQGHTRCDKIAARAPNSCGPRSFQRTPWVSPTRSLTHTRHTNPPPTRQGRTTAAGQQHKKKIQGDW